MRKIVKLLIALLLLGVIFISATRFSVANIENINTLICEIEPSTAPNLIETVEDSLDVCIPNCKFIAITTDALNLRSSPHIEADSLKIMRENTLIIVHDTTNSPWWYVEHNGILGYCHSDYLNFFEDNSIAEYPIAVYTTTFSTKNSQQGRAFNIAKATELLDYTEISPNEVFSILNEIGPITESAGYAEAIEYKIKNGEAYSAIGYGGGVCQVSSTLYNAYLLASNLLNLELIERHEHALPVSYVSQGMDATISYSSKKDFKFKNLSNNTLVIRCYSSGNGCLSIYISIKELA